MKIQMYDHIQSVENLPGGLVRVVAVFPEWFLAVLKEYPSPLDDAARFLAVRNRCSKASQVRLYRVNEKLDLIAEGKPCVV